jgi:hypothetical protein
MAPAPVPGRQAVAKLEPTPAAPGAVGAAVKSPYVTAASAPTTSSTPMAAPSLVSLMQNPPAPAAPAKPPATPAVAATPAALPPVTQPAPASAPAPMVTRETPAASPPSAPASPPAEAAAAPAHDAIKQVGYQEAQPAHEPHAGPEPAVPPQADTSAAVHRIDKEVIGPQESFHNRDAVSSRRSYVDLTVQPWFGHAADHSWLSGQVVYAHSSNTWRLHYASVDSADPYGGTVTLMPSDKLADLKDGQYVRVEGHLTKPNDKEPDSPYEVTAVKVIDKEK